MSLPLRLAARSIALLFVGCLVLAAPSFAADDAAAPPAVNFQFPQNPASWINSGPITAQALAGKGVVLYFYEEGCPRCKERWPQLLQTAQQFAGQPVFFVAVNSGTTRPNVENYVRAQRIPWPVIVDADRSFERACRIPEVSLNNIYQAAVLRPDGQLARGDAGDLAATARAALEGAAWRVDPSGLPKNVMPAWQELELGNFQPAAAFVKKGLNSSDEATKAAAEKLDQAVQKTLEPKLAAASAHLEKGEKWPAYKLYDELNTQYAGFRLPPEVAEQVKRLAADLDVTVEVSARQSLLAAQKIAARGSDSSRRRAVSMLRKLVADAPQTEAAMQAMQVLQQVDAPQAP